MLKKNLLTTAKSIVEELTDVSTIHSVKYRVKDAEHLIEKIIRKRAENQKDINSTNYMEQITDLIGIRVLHLFKEEWEGIHDFILKQWELKEKPKANIREGDLKLIRDKYEAKECTISIHKAGYRSVHYLIVSNLTKKQFTTEIQVRTIFEEAWSEIDHKIRYPYNMKDEVLSLCLEIFNRLAGSADEMGSYINFLHKNISEKNNDFSEELNEKDKIIFEQKNEIENLKRQKAEFVNRISKNKKNITSNMNGIVSKNPAMQISMKDLEEYLLKSPKVSQIDQLALIAGFDVESLGYEANMEEQIMDLMLYLQKVGITNIKKLDEFIEKCLPNSEDYYKAQINSSKEPWGTDICFNIILLILVNYKDKFTYDVLIDDFRWHVTIADRVLSVIEAWDKNNRR